MMNIIGLKPLGFAACFVVGGGVFVGSVLGWNISPAQACEAHAAEAASAKVAQRHSHTHSDGHGHDEAHMNGESTEYVHADHAFARATVGMARSGGAFVSLANHGDQPVRLIGAETSVAERVEVHMHQMENGVMRMVHLEEGLVLPAHETTKLQPGGNHLMLMGLNAPLQEGTSFPITLYFEAHSPVVVDIAVKPLAFRGFDDADSMMHSDDATHALDTHPESSSH